MQISGLFPTNENVSAGRKGRLRGNVSMAPLQLLGCDANGKFVLGREMKGTLDYFHGA